MTKPGILFRFVNAFRRKSFTTLLPTTPGEATFFRDNYREFATEGYGKNVYVNMSIAKVATTAAGIPWMLTDTSRDKEILEHDLLTLLSRPNPLMGGATFTQAMVSYYLIDGNEFVFTVTPDTAGILPPSELWPVQPNMIKKTLVKVGLKTEEKFDFKNKNGTLTPIPAGRILHLKTFNPLDPFMGLSPIRSARLSIVQSNESKGWNVSLLQNHARPPGAWVSKENLQPQQESRIREQIHEKWAGAANAGKPFVFSGGMEWIPFALNPSDMDWLEGQKISSREIALIFGVPPELIGDSSNKTYSNYKEARKAFYQETILPLMIFLRDEFNNWLVPKFGDNLFLDFDTDQIPALQEEQGELFERANKSTFLTTNEKRVMTGFEPIGSEGDVILVPFGLAPLELVGTGSGHEDEEENDKAITLDSKAFNLKTRERRQFFWKHFDQRREPFVPRVQSLVGKQLLKDFRAAARAVAKSTTSEDLDAAISAAVFGNRDKWDKIYDTIYMNISDEFAKEVFSQIKGVAAPEQKIEGVIPEDQARDVWLEEIRSWLADNSTTRELGIMDTTTKQVRKEIEAGIAAGDSIPKIAKRIEALGKQLTPNRAMLIANTEVISASNLGSIAAARATGLSLQKEWIATADDRVRDAHASADGDIVKSMDDAFNVDGEDLLFPGDTSQGATGKNIFNCRCTVGYIAIDSLDDEVIANV